MLISVTSTREIKSKAFHGVYSVTPVFDRHLLGGAFLWQPVNIPVFSGSFVGSPCVLLSSRKSPLSTGGGSSKQLGVSHKQDSKTPERTVSEYFKKDKQRLK